MAESDSNSRYKIENLSAAELELRGIKSRRTVRNYAIVAAFVGLVPIPLLDLLILVGLQVGMMRKLVELYGLPYSGLRVVKSVFTSVFGGFIFPSLALPAVASLLKFIPGLGTLAGTAVMPLVGVIMIFLVGRAAMMDLESGENLFTLQPERLRGAFDAYYQEGAQSAEAAAEVEESAREEKEPKRGFFSRSRASA